MRRLKTGLPTRSSISCRREAARCFVSLNISLNHSTTFFSRAKDSKSQFHCNYVSISCRSSSNNGVRDLEIWFRGRSRSLQMTTFDRPHAFHSMPNYSRILYHLREKKRDISRKSRFVMPQSHVAFVAPVTTVPVGILPQGLV